MTRAVTAPAAMSTGAMVTAMPRRIEPSMDTLR